jgi:RNA polymerase subunit RPABC4/transcription elongation factor Spt4
MKICINCNANHTDQTWVCPECGFKTKRIFGHVALIDDQEQFAVCIKQRETK